MAGDFCAALLLLTPLLTAIWFLTPPGGSGPPLLRGRDTVLLAPAPSPGRRAVRTPVALVRPGAAVAGGAARPLPLPTLPTLPTLPMPQPLGIGSDAHSRNFAWMQEGFPNIMYPLVRSASGQATETKPYQESPQGFLRMADGFVDELERTRAAMRGLLHNITLLKTNPYGMEVMREIGDLSHPGYAPAKGGSEAPRWQVIARAVQAAEPFLQRIMIVRQLFGDPPFAYGPDFLWAGRPPFRSVNMASVRDATMGFL